MRQNFIKLVTQLPTNNKHQIELKETRYAIMCVKTITNCCFQKFMFCNFVLDRPILWSQNRMTSEFPENDFTMPAGRHACGMFGTWALAYWRHQWAACKLAHDFRDAEENIKTALFSIVASKPQHNLSSIQSVTSRI